MRFARMIELRVAAWVCAVGLGATGLGAIGCATASPTFSPSEGLVAFDPVRGRWTTANEVWDRILSARYVMLGEHHDHPDHHRLQAAIVRDVASRGRRPALGFEMLDADDQPNMDELAAAGELDPEAWRRAVAWDDSGWPAWSTYEPVFSAALEAGLPIVAAQIPDSLRTGLVTEGAGALSRAEVRNVATLPLPDAAQTDLEEAIREGHCNMLPEAQIPRMVEIQRIWEAWMAEVLRTSATDDGAILVVGRGHARRDRGIPWALERFDPEATTLSVAFVEASLEDADESDWQRWADEEKADLLGYDLVFVTRPIEREDPCERLANFGRDAASGAGKDE